MTRIFFIALVAGLLVCAPAIAQDTAIAKKNRKFTFKPVTEFDQRFSFLEQQSVYIWGFRFGTMVNDKFKTGLGGYFLEQNKTGERRLRRGTLQYEQNRRLYFGTVYFEPFLLRKRLYDVSILLEAGYGKVYLDSLKKFNNNSILVSEKQTFVPTAAGLGFYFKTPEIKNLHFLSYIGLKAFAGYRKTVFESDLKYNYDGWYWSVGGVIFMDKIFTDLKNRKKQKALAKQQAIANPIQ